jgi:very-short-patch-repair endonuclease
VTVRIPRRPRAAVAFHAAALAPDEVAIDEGIPTTTPGRTLLDLAPLLPSAALARAVEAAELNRLYAGAPLAELIDRHPGRPGVPKLRRILGRPITRTRSDLEARFLELVRAAGLPNPEVNGLVELPGRRVEVDFVWRSQRLVVEIDGGSVHATSFAFERDRARDRALHAAGLTVIRVTERQLDREPGALTADIRLLLGSRGTSR